MKTSCPVIYMQVDSHVQVNHKTVRAGELGQFYCSDKQIEEKIKQTVIAVFSDSEAGANKTASALWLIQKLDEAVEGEVTFKNIGEADFVISLNFCRKKDKLKGAKIVFVAAVTFAGSIFAIMTYNEDVSAMEVFLKLAEIFGAGKDGVKMLAAGYAFGIAAGIILFFNHFGKKRLTKDPTPMEVEMEKYERDVDDTLIKKNSRKGKNLGHF